MHPARLIRVLLVALCLCAGASPALAHAVLLNSDPQDGQAFETAPKSAKLSFDEAVQVTRLQAVLSDGTVIAAAGPWPLSDTITWTFPETLPDGGWLLSYSVISSDSHPVSGTIRFAVGDGDITFGDVPQQADTLIEYPRFVMLAGTLASVGLIFAVAFFGAPVRRGMRTGLLCAFAASLIGSASFVYATQNAAGGGEAALAAALRILGPGLAVIAVSLAAGVAASSAGYRRAAVACALVTLIGLGLSGHVAAVPPEWLSRPIYTAHVAAAALWLGSLLILLRYRRSRGPAWSPAAASVLAPWPQDGVALYGEALATSYVAAGALAGEVQASGVVPLGRAGAAISSAGGPGGERDVLALFSQIAPWMVGVLVLCGASLLTIQAGDPQTLIASRYGLLIAIKLGFVTLLVGLAAYNRWRLTRPVLAGEAGAERRLRLSIGAELALTAAILAVTALLGTAVPPRSLAAASIPPCSVPGGVTRTGSDIGLNVTMTFKSACSGRNNIGLAMAWQDGHPVDAQEVQVQFELPALNIEPFDVYLDGKGGSGSVANYTLTPPGTWQVEVRILLDEFTLRRVVFKVPLAPN